MDDRTVACGPPLAVTNSAAVNGTGYPAPHVGARSNRVINGSGFPGAALALRSVTLRADAGSATATRAMTARRNGRRTRRLARCMFAAPAMGDAAFRRGAARRNESWGRYADPVHIVDASTTDRQGL